MASALILELSQVPVRVRPEAKGDLAMGSPTQQTDSVLSVGAADFVLDQLRLAPSPLTQEEAQKIIRGVIEIVSPQINYLSGVWPIQEVLEGHARRRALVPKLGNTTHPGGFPPRIKVLEVLCCWSDTPAVGRSWRFLYLTAGGDLLSLDLIVSSIDEALHWEVAPLEVEQVFDHFLSYTTATVRNRDTFELDVRGITSEICASLLQTVVATVERRTSQLEVMRKMRTQLDGLDERLKKIPMQSDPS